MPEIPTQPAGRDVCSHCASPVHLVNRQLEAVWVHDADGFEWCPPLKAVPASREWPEVAT